MRPPRARARFRLRIRVRVRARARARVRARVRVRVRPPPIALGKSPITAASRPTSFRAESGERFGAGGSGG